MLQESAKSPVDVAASSPGQRAYRACERVTKDLMRSNVVDRKLVESLVRLECEQVLLGHLLGTGSFCHVTQVNRIALKPATTTENALSEVAHQRQILQTSSTKDKYAIKFLRNDLNPNKFCQGAAELVMETLLLSSLSHGNIISIHGVSLDGPAGFESGNGYFIVIDRLGMTLDQQIPLWRDLERRHQGDAATMQSLFVQRLTVVAEVASALSYLHSKCIIYRGIDPTNFAFNDEGHVVLFDLGLARELDKSRLSGDGINYELSGNKGNIQYMAPENGSCQPYGLRADVYGIAVLLWQLCALAPSPFPGLASGDQFIERIVRKKERPCIQQSWPDTLKYLIQSSWADESSGRPPMKHFHRNLLHEIEDIQAIRLASKPRVHLRGVDQTMPMSRMHLHSSTSMAQYSPVSPNRPLESPARASKVLRGDSIAPPIHGIAAGPNPNGVESRRNLVPQTPISKGFFRPRRPTFQKQQEKNIVDNNNNNNSKQAHKIPESPQPTGEGPKISIESHPQKSAQPDHCHRQTLEEKLRLVNAAFRVMGPQQDGSTCLESPSPSLTSEENSSSSSGQRYSMLQRSSSQPIRTAPGRPDTSQRRHSWVEETNPVLRELRAKKWQEAFSKEEVTHGTATILRNGNFDTLDSANIKVTTRFQSRSSTPQEANHDLLRKASSSRCIQNAHERGAGSAFVTTTGAPVRGKSGPTKDIIRKVQFMSNNSAGH